MPDKSFSNELVRVLARPDIDELRRKLSIHHDYSVSEKKSDDDWTDECDDVLLSGNHDPDLALAFVALAASTYDEPYYLGLLAAGPLEDALDHVVPEIVDRIVAEARRSARFRWMLSGVWLRSIHPANVDTIRKAVGDVSMDDGDPLPPRPWA